MHDTEYQKVTTQHGVMVQVPLKDFQQFVEDSNFLVALYAVGLDNWEGYEEAQTFLEETN